MNDTAVREIQEITAAALVRGPLSRETMERRLRRGDYHAADIEKVLSGVDWEAEAERLVGMMPPASAAVPNGIREILFVAGFTPDEISSVMNRMDWQTCLSQNVRDLLQSGTSRRNAYNRLIGVGFSDAEIDEAFSVLEPGTWEQQAARRLNEWYETWTSYSDLDPVGFLQAENFTTAEIEYAMNNHSWGLRDLALREAQLLYERGLDDDAIKLALWYSGVPESDAGFAAASIVRGPESVLERRFRSYLEREVRTEQGLREALGNCTSTEWQQLSTQFGAETFDWVEMAREAILRRLESWTVGRGRAREQLLKEGFSADQVDAVLPGFDWAPRAAAAAQQHIDRLEAFAPSDLVDALCRDGFTRQEAYDAARSAVWPVYFPEDADAAWIRRLYIKPALREEAVAQLKLRGHNEPEIDAMLDEAGFDWDAQLPKLVRIWFGKESERMPLTPAAARRQIGQHLSIDIPEGLLDQLGCDWTSEAQRIVQEMMKTHWPKELIRRRLSDDGFSPSMIASAMQKAAEGRPLSPGTCALHMQQILETSNFSRAGVEDELKMLGYDWQEIAKAQTDDPALDLNKVDWKKRALAWIRTEAAQRNLSRSDLHGQLVKEGFTPQEISWALAKAKLTLA